MSDKPSYLNFDNKKYPWKKDINYKENPHLYKVGKGEQGVLICEPYKSAIGKYWSFRTPEIAKESSEKIFQLFLGYLEQDDFVGADMARKYLQMGFTRARRYTNYKGGHKYDKTDDYKLLQKGTGEPQKAISADIFFKKWKLAENNNKYITFKTQWKEKYS
ncbi:hypothetical protein ABSA28_00899 [Candidatus Hepatincolaceae symbiont of Richtersius coronifer]